MKKLLLIMLVLFMIIIFSIYGLLTKGKIQSNSLKNYNREYEEYLNKKISGTELATLINKVININEKNDLKKDENNYYIENQEDSIKIEIELAITEKTYPMEEIYNKDTAEFVKHFSLENFQCTSIAYHKETGKVSKMLFKQIGE